MMSIDRANESEVALYPPPSNTHCFSYIDISKDNLKTAQILVEFHFNLYTGKESHDSKRNYTIQCL